MDCASSTHEYYESHAAEYFEATYKVDLQSLCDTMCRYLEPPASILDLGCGSGRDILYFARRGFHVVGLDYSFQLLNLARALSGQPVVQADIRAIPFRDESFNAVWAVASLLHLNRERNAEVLVRIRKLLKSDGLLLTSVKRGEGEVIDARGRCTSFYQPEEWESLLMKGGFTILEMEEKLEVRQSENGGVSEIIWISYLAQAQELKR
jgi:SAM-dependent methyltransferase